MKRTDGSDRRAVESGGTASPNPAGSRGREGPTVEGSTRHLERGVLDPPDRNALGGSARSVSSQSDVPPKVSAVGSGRHHRQAVESDRTGPARARWSRPDRIVHRRLLPGAQKGSPASGKPRQARGPRSWQSQTALVFLSPFWIESASPHEVTLVEKTLDQMLIDEQPECLIGDSISDSDKRLLERWSSAASISPRPLRSPRR